ncbi:hypothetical protein CIHG_09369 [Coccidioides immitis H538.4]|uniref:thiol oxidase n=1 Tax=Coccidioides immitis H538.4 TaxID=396776 RepID=A0A0J8S5C1_COCIT|nr:hypothetical protein CIHG_09369 [Coccidioides immitis H538.4]
MATRPTSRLFVLTGMVVFFILTITFFRQPAPLSPKLRAPGHLGKSLPSVDVSDRMLEGNIVMPQLGNATAKAELGRASWRLLHTMMARFPESPSKEEQDALRSYIYLFARLYPWCVGFSFLRSTNSDGPDADVIDHEGKPKQKGEIPAGRLNQLTNLGREFNTDALLPVEISAEP